MEQSFNLFGKIRKFRRVSKNNDIPYEVRMKHIIKAYRNDQEKMSKLAGYTKHLECEVIRLKEIMIANGYSDDGVLGNSEPINIIKKLRKEINELHIKLKELKEQKEQKKLEDLLKKIKILEDRIENVYPKRKYKATTFQRVIKSQELYIEALQKLLDENGIPYHPRIPINDLEAQGADRIDVNAVR